MSLCGALVVLYLFFIAIGGVDPTDTDGWTIAALVLAIIWLAYSWRRLWAGGASPPPTASAAASSAGWFRPGWLRRLRAPGLGSERLQQGW